MKKDLLKRLAKGLLKVPKEKFQMEMWGKGTLNVKSRGFKCEYAGCAIGWAPKILKDDCPIKMVPHMFDPDLLMPVAKSAKVKKHSGFLGCQYRRVALAFGLTVDETEYLFNPDAYSGRVSPKEVSNRILHFLKNGLPA